MAGMGWFGEMKMRWWLAQLGDADWQAREQACRRLGELRAVAAVEALIARLDDEDTAVRRSACLALAEIGDGRGLEALLERLADSELAVRRAAEDALQLMGFGALAALFDAAVNPLALASLQPHHRARMQPLLRRWLAGHSLRQRQLACLGLGRLGDEDAVSALMARLTDDAWQVQEAAILALGHLRDARAVRPLSQLLQAPDAILRQSVCTALGQIGAREAVGLLRYALRDLTPSVRVEAVRALSVLGDTAVVPELIALLADPQVAVREALCEALGQLRDARAVEPLLARLQDGSPLVRSAACHALGLLGDTRAVAPLLVLVETLTGETLLAACEALAQLGEGALIDSLRRFFAETPDSAPVFGDARLARIAHRWAESPYSAMRARACRLLTALGEIDAVIVLLSDDAPEVRKAVCEVLAVQQVPVAVELLIGCLEEARSDIRILACRCLGQQGDARAVTPLLTCVGVENRDVRDAACEALITLGEAPLGRALQGALQGIAGARDALTQYAVRGDLRMLGPLTALAFAVSSNDPDAPAIYQTVTAISTGLQPVTATLCCTACLTRIERRTITQANATKTEILVCRNCRHADTLAVGVREIVAVLDDDMPGTVTFAQHTARVNAQRREGLFDFDRVEIGRATDFAIEQFCMRAGNDTDPVRGPRARKVPVTVCADGRVSENALRVLDHVFGTVVFISGEPISAEFRAGEMG